MMVYLNKFGYLERKTHAGKRNPNGKSTKRDWWFVNYRTKYSIGIMFYNHSIALPKKYVGKRVRFKIEVIK